MNFTTTLLIIIASVSARLACASPSVIDQFAHPDGPLDGQNGGGGWDGAWFGVGDTVFNPGLSYTDGTRFLDVAGGAIQADGSGSGDFRDLTVSMPQGTTFYVSFIGQVTSGSSVGLNLNSGGSPQFLIGKLPSASNWGIQDFVGNSSVSAVSATLQSLLVLRIDVLAIGTDTFSLYVNPSLLSEPSLPDASFTTNNGSFSITQLRIQALGGPVNGVFDELRFGQTYADVTPFSVPEPTVFALATFGFAGVAFFCKRRTR